MLRPTGGGPRRPVAYTPRHGPPFSPAACLARAGEIGYDRVLFFSDAVFAIAITLLIVDLQVPDVPNLQSGRQLRESIPRMAGFALSFAAAGLAEAAVWLCAIHIRDLRPARRPPLVHRWVLLRILPAPAVFLLSIPFAIRQPVLGQYLWLLALVSAPGDPPPGTPRDRPDNHRER
jgi:hypothetical protein